MPIDISQYREPKLVRDRVRYTMAGIPNQRARFINFELYPRSYRGGEFRQAGYNVNHQSVRVERVNLYSDDYTLKPR